MGTIEQYKPIPIPSGLPPVVEWMRDIDPIKYSQFTIDWIEGVVDDYQIMYENNVLPPLNECHQAIIYDCANVTEIMRPDLLDVAFFKEVVRRCGEISE